MGQVFSNLKSHLSLKYFSIHDKPQIQNIDSWKYFKFRRYNSFIICFPKPKHLVFLNQANRNRKNCNSWTRHIVTSLVNNTTSKTLTHNSQLDEKTSNGLGIQLTLISTCISFLHILNLQNPLIVSTCSIENWPEPHVSCVCISTNSKDVKVVMTNPRNLQKLRKTCKRKLFLGLKVSMHFC